MSLEGLPDDFVLSTLRTSECFQRVKNGKKIVNVSPSVLSKDGYLSIVYLVEVIFNDDSKFSCILKIPSAKRYIEAMGQDEKNANLAPLETLHNRECQAFEILRQCNTTAPKLYASKQVVDVAKDSGYVLMESFVDNAAVFGIFTAPTEEQCINVAHNLGKLRAEVAKVPLESYSMWNEPFRVEQDMLTVLMQKHIPALIKHDKETFGPLTEELEPFTNRKTFSYLMKGHAEKLGVQSLTHGDLHGGNMIVKLNPDGSRSNEIASFIDWQTSFCGNSLYDLTTFLSFADAKTRHKMEKIVLDEYYNTYLEHCQSPDPNFSREICQELYDIALMMSGIEWQHWFGILTDNSGNMNEDDMKELKEKLAVQTRDVIQDAIRLIRKYDLQSLINNA
ncbi:unnamed protein product [Bursaphelenchus xylophilus]|uniref:(pine wood nematode) hypothetical protein n=1 Tax=Bursaphelenchus xylophilus TaxID=6326 RepID=A0A1I7S4V2_BURXY|nr:unnamed protein product [Bursaphelenchus xylophilus]CAG9117397.1 unnamed protein product [Bursaphelenchus xylophilus]